LEHGASLAEEVQADAVEFSRSAADEAKIEGVALGIEVAKA